MANLKSFGTTLNKGVVKFSNNLVVKTVAAGMARLLPVTMVGSVCTLLISLPWDPYTEFITNIGISKFLQLGSTMTNDIISIYVVVVMAFEMSRLLKKSQLDAVLTAVVSFFVVTPMTLALIGEAEVSVFTTTYLGSRGMFVAMIVGMVATYLFSIFTDHGPKVKMPASVPPAISGAFESLFPVIFVSGIFICVNALFSFTSAGDMHTFIYSVLQAPLEGLGSSIWTMCLIVLLGEFFWFFGIHGSNVTGAVTSALWMAPAIENTQAVANGMAAPNTLNYYALNIYKGPRHLVLSAMLLIMPKSKQLKAVGKVAIVPGIFGISEPMKFGIPMVLNPTILIPMSLAPVISVLIYFGACQIGFLAPAAINLPWSMPPIISGLLAGGWQGAVIQLLQMVAIFVLYLPFFKMLDKQKCAQEAEQERMLEEQAAASAA